MLRATFVGGGGGGGRGWTKRKRGKETGGDRRAAIGRGVRALESGAHSVNDHSGRLNHRASVASSVGFVRDISRRARKSRRQITEKQPRRGKTYVGSRRHDQGNNFLQLLPLLPGTPGLLRFVKEVFHITTDPNLWSFVHLVLGQRRACLSYTSLLQSIQAGGTCRERWLG